MLVKKWSFSASFIFLILVACNSSKQGNNNNNAVPEINQEEIKTEIEKWKKELLETKQIGKPCDYKNIETSALQNWMEENPGQLDGLPSDDKEIKAIRADFNDDNKEDLLLYFQGKNCTGHNGGTKTYAKIICSDGTSKTDLMSEIINAIQSAYNKKRKTDKNLKEVTIDYMETTTTINGYHNGITGQFRLYTKDDAHCCPSYTGTYTYQPEEKNMKIQISENNNQ